MVNSNLNQKISNIINIPIGCSVDVSGCKVIFFQIVGGNKVRASGFMSALTDNNIKSVYKGSSQDWEQTFNLINNKLNFTSTNNNDSANIICIM